MEGVDFLIYSVDVGDFSSKVKGAVWLCILGLLGKGLDCHIGV